MSPKLQWVSWIPTGLQLPHLQLRPPRPEALATFATISKSIAQLKRLSRLLMANPPFTILFVHKAVVVDATRIGIIVGDNKIATPPHPSPTADAPDKPTCQSPGRENAQSRGDYRSTHGFDLLRRRTTQTSINQQHFVIDLQQQQHHYPNLGHNESLQERIQLASEPPPVKHFTEPHCSRSPTSHRCISVYSTCPLHNSQEAGHQPQRPPSIFWSG